MMRAMLNSNRYRYLRGKLFFPALAMAVLTAFSSLAITNLISRVALSLPPENFEILYSGGFYNFVVLRVERLEYLANLTIEQLMSSAFIGGFLAMILAIFIPMFICGSFRDGFIQSAYVRGNSKTSILTSYVLSSLEIFIAVFVVYILSLLLFSSVVLDVEINANAMLGLLPVFALQLFAHIVFLTVCISSAFMINKTATCIVALLFGVVIFPGLLTTFDVVLQSNFSLSSLWIVSIIGLWSAAPPINFVFSFIVAWVTIFIAIGTTLLLFIFSDIKQ